MASGVPRPILTHSQRVCRLYKAALKNIKDYSYNIYDRRYESVKLRARFDATKKETDMSKLAAMVEVGEEELFERNHPEPFIYRKDPEGISYKRDENDLEDFVLDLWHPWEKANYIDYFETREKRKFEYPDYYENSLLKKGLIDLNTVDYPTIGPAMTPFVPSESTKSQQESK